MRQRMNIIFKVKILDIKSNYLLDLEVCSQNLIYPPH
jgi:hypothetical protein